jgi:glycosyltransferase involved in cell wall biosynthesis
MMHLQILGTRGIPSAHGGFETFAHDLALYLVARGHEVTVYCQVNPGETQREDLWHGVRRILIPSSEGVRGTILFDWKSVLHASREAGVTLTLGYNTAIFSALYRIKGHKNVINMDGLEWKRQKWSPLARAWLRLNEWLGSRFGDHLIADHPVIAEHLRQHTRADKISMIPYGSDGVDDRDDSVLDKHGLIAGNYYLMIARPEPENSILEVVEAYSAQKRKLPLVVLGKYSYGLAYHAAVLKKANSGVRFLGPVYDRRAVSALRHHATVYIHGHQVGGTNPSLVESLAAGNPVIAHDNLFTRWVIGEGGMYFNDEASLKDIFAEIDSSRHHLEACRLSSRSRHQHEFMQDSVLRQYETLLLQFANAYSVEGLEISRKEALAIAPLSEK